MVNIVVGGFVGAVITRLWRRPAWRSSEWPARRSHLGTNLFRAQNGGAMMIGAWWAFVPSGLALALVAFGLALINYGMDEITNPRLIAAEGRQIGAQEGEESSPQAWYPGGAA